MIEWCVENNIGFGICSLIKGDISHVGTFVKIHSILKRYENGELDIIVKGTGRISVSEISIHPDGYHLGTIEEYSDLLTIVNDGAIENLKEIFLKLINLVDFRLDNTFWESFDRTKLKSFKLAEKSGLSLEQQQELITLTTEKSRINFLIEHLENLNKEIREKSALKKIIASDGYLN
jgi:Lon protease-like protein